MIVDVEVEEEEEEEPPLDLSCSGATGSQASQSASELAA